MTIFTVDENYTSKLMDQTQTPSQVWQTGAISFLSALNIFLSITALLGNALILVALHRVCSLYPPTKLLFRCLAFTDLCIGLISQPLFSVSRMSFITTGMDQKVIYYVGKIFYASSFTLCGVSVFTSTAISVDRLLALVLGLRYRHAVTLRRVRAVIVCNWLIGISCGSMCFWNRRIAFTVTFAITILFIATSIFSYTKIYLQLRHHQLQVQEQANGRRFPLNIERYKKTVSSVLWVQLALVICYTPFIVVVMLTTYGGMFGHDRFEVAFSFTATLTYLSSSLNPILYCWKIRTVKQAAKETIKQLYCCT